MGSSMKRNLKRHVDTMNTEDSYYSKLLCRYLDSLEEQDEETDWDEKRKERLEDLDEDNFP